MTACLSMDSPFGTLLLTGDGTAVTGLHWGDSLPDELPPNRIDGILAAARDRLSAYFSGTPVSFDIPVHSPTGTVFQRRVWQLMTEIPYGATKSYGDLAAALGSAARAVGTACGANPIPILVPCHRVVAANGRLGGFSGHHGPDTKRRLLILEGVLLPL